MWPKVKLFFVLVFAALVILLSTHLALRTQLGNHSFHLIHSVSLNQYVKGNTHKEVLTNQHQSNEVPTHQQQSTLNTNPVQQKASFRNHNEEATVVNIKPDIITTKEKDIPSSKLHDKTVTEIKEESSTIMKTEKAVTETNNIKKDNSEEVLKKEESLPVATTLATVVPVDDVVTGKLPLCSNRGKGLVGLMLIDQTAPKSLDVIEKVLSTTYGGFVEKGGWWSPTTCKPRVKVAVIIPYRKRFEQLKIFLRHMHPVLKRQQLYYRIIIVEQLSNDSFNRAGLFNIGYTEALKLGEFTCFIFTDVDLLPEDDRNYYGCPTSPRHMSVAVDKFNYRLPYTTIFGGVGAFTKEHFESINGMSNLFWGWGGEDDDLYKRISNRGLSLTRPSMQIGRYAMIKVNHFQSSHADPNRMHLLQNSAQRMIVDGLNTLKYGLKKVIEDPLVTYIQVDMKKSMYNM